MIRMGIGIGTLALAAALLAGPVQAQRAELASAAPDQVALTVYQDPSGTGFYNGRAGLALITEWRTVDLPAGESRISFRGVAAGIVPSTAALDGLPADVAERNQDYNLLSPGSILAAAVGEPVKLVRTNPRTGEETVRNAIVRSGPNGVILEVDGGYEALGCSGDPERLVFDKIPDALKPEPTLSMLVRAKTPGRYKVRLTYLAVGLNWKANYVANVRPDGKTLDLTGWITLSNDSATTFTDAPTQVVAGTVSRSWRTAAKVVYGQRIQSACWPTGLNFAEEIVLTGSRVSRSPPMAMAPPPPPPPPAPPPPPPAPAFQAEQSELGDYKLYTLPFPTTVAGRQTKQLLMLKAEGVAFDRVYRFSAWPSANFSADGEPVAVDLLMRMKNRKESGLGLPIPGGNATITQQTPDGNLIAGSYKFENSPVGAPFDLTLSSSRQVEVTPVLVSDVTKSRGRRREYTYAMEAVNHTSAPQTFELRVMQSYQVFKITKATVKPVSRDGGRVMAVTLAPGERRTLRYTVQITQ